MSKALNLGYFWLGAGVDQDLLCANLQGSRLQRVRVENLSANKLAETASLINRSRLSLTSMLGQNEWKWTLYSKSQKVNRSRR